MGVRNLLLLDEKSSMRPALGFPVKIPAVNKPHALAAPLQDRLEREAEVEVKIPVGNRKPLRIIPRGG